MRSFFQPVFDPSPVFIFVEATSIILIWSFILLK